MSKSQVKEDWRARIKDLLVSKCTPICETTKSAHTSQRYSLDFDSNFKNILLKTPQFVQICEKEELGYQDVNNDLSVPTFKNSEEKKNKGLEKENKSTRFVDYAMCSGHEKLTLQHPTHESFVGVENICNDTPVITPDNSLLQHLQNKQKDDVVGNDNKVSNEFSSLTTECNLNSLRLGDNETSASKILLRCSEENFFQNQSENIVANCNYGLHSFPHSTKWVDPPTNKPDAIVKDEYTSGVEKKEDLNDSIIVLSDDGGSSDDNKEYRELFKEEVKEETCNLEKIIFNSDNIKNPCENEIEEKENSCTIDTSFQRSFEFNDTLEEVNHILELLERNGKSNALSNSNLNLGNPKISPKPLKIRQNTFTISSKKNYVEPPKPIKTPLVKFTKVNRVNTNNSPKTSAASNTKSKMFKTPNTKRIETKVNKLSSSNNKQFAHIVSPIGTYIKKSGTTSLISTHSLKTPNNMCNAVNRELVFASRTGTKEESNNIPVVSRALPKKAYISSDLKHYVDERTPVTIPEVSKVKNYIDTARLPAVLRHDGKYKLPISGRTFDSSPKSPFIKKANAGTSQNYAHAINASLANLSVTTGDVSLYTIKDAQIL
ncbi:uncharacterized protein LOC119687589 [Teleopsis dalmanni]|uniref:uncharacterized protein LOC119687589 n=1 Tax=Teleopsis dalmanni TaxID=139649 RepID=UPI0018CF95B7|nr:uncharacterized protein LOC119687589 [Teleopsis dalmanni]